jgi:hypothetical protein
MWMRFLCRIYYRTDGIPVVEFYTHCSRCQGFPNGHCWHEWIYYLLLDRMWQFLVRKKNIAFFGKILRVLFFGLYYSKCKCWVCISSISYFGLSVIKNWIKLNKNALNNVFTKSTNWNLNAQFFMRCGQTNIFVLLYEWDEFVFNL